METRVKLLMSFKDADGKGVSISIDNPRTDLTEAEIIAAMNLIISKNIFAPGGLAITTALEAKIVETNTNTHDLVI